MENKSALRSGYTMTSIYDTIFDKMLLCAHLERNALVLVLDNGDDVIAVKRELFPGISSQESVLHGLGEQASKVYSLLIDSLVFIDMEELRINNSEESPALFSGAS